MMVVADARLLVAELLRRRGREPLAHPELHVVVAQAQWEETRPELSRRLNILESREVIDKQRRDALESHVFDLVEARIIEVVPRGTYALLRETALRRVPRD